MSFENGMKTLSLESLDYDTDLIPTYDITRLSQVKKLVEKNLYDLYDNLKGFNCDLDTKLLTPDGFPRADIDVVQVRLLRTRIIRLQNDYKSILNAIELKMKSFFSNSQNGTADKTVSTIEDTTMAVPFAKVSRIVSNSPAETAGLILQDKIVSIGHINATNHDNLKNVPGLVKDHLNKELNLTVVRNTGETVKLKLIPKNNWGGQGILGCKLDQL